VIHTEKPELPTTRQLVRASIAAGVVVTILVVTTVLPAELAIDPTGIGRVLGLTALGELKHGAHPAAAPPLVDANAEHVARTDTLDVVLAPNEGAEVKATMKAGAELVWSWSTDGGPVFFDFHGEPKGAPPDVFESFGTGTEVSAEGTFVAPFEGVHGWYWKNNTREPVTVRVTASGVYQSLARKP
jgi:hypothetical protein